MHDRFVSSVERYDLRNDGLEEEMICDKKEWYIAINITKYKHYSRHIKLDTYYHHINLKKQSKKKEYISINNINLNRI